MSKAPSVTNEKGVLGFVELWAIGVGQVIGAGIITLVGPAIALTGHSVWFAYFLAIIIGLLSNLPLIIFSSVTKFSGGEYSIITALGGEKLGGMYIVGFSLQLLLMSLFATALGMYTTSILPQVSGKAAGIFFLVLFYFINLLGMANMANTQKLMSAILAAALLMFVVVGFPQADFSHSFNFFSDVFYAGGPVGFFKAVLLLVYSCQGYKLNVNYGNEAKNPTRDIPRSMLAVAPVLVVLYCGIALVASAVLPLDVVANKPLTLVATQILPNTLFFLFIIGGPIMALLTTMNSTYGAMVGPFATAARDGWFPKKLAATNKRGAAVIILTIQLLVALVPVLLNFSVTTIVNNLMLITAVYSCMLFYSLAQMPKKMPQKWAKATLHMSNGLYYFVLAVAFVIQLAIGINSMLSLTPALTIFNLSVLVLGFLYALLRHKSGKTQVQTASMLELE